MPIQALTIICPFDIGCLWYWEYVYSHHNYEMHIVIPVIIFTIFIIKLITIIKIVIVRSIWMNLRQRSTPMLMASSPSLSLSVSVIFLFFKCLDYCDADGDGDAEAEAKLICWFANSSSEWSDWQEFKWIIGMVHLSSHN